MAMCMCVCVCACVCVAMCRVHQLAINMSHTSTTINNGNRYVVCRLMLCNNACYLPFSIREREEVSFGYIQDRL